MDKHTAAKVDRKLTGTIGQYRQALSAGLFRPVLDVAPISPSKQLEIVLELIVDRISSGFTSRRFLDCYREFIQGVEWTMESSMEDIGRHYADAHSRYYAAVANVEQILENYLVNYVCKTLFPFGARAVTQKLGLSSHSRPAFARYMLLASHYAMVHTVSVGMAGFHKTSFHSGHLLKAIQSCTKTFEHSLTHPCRVLDILSGKGIERSADLSVLFRDVETPVASYAIMKQAVCAST